MVVRYMEPTGNKAVCSNLCIFIDCGYLQLAKAQVPPRTNVIQIMEEELQVKFLGTCKNNAAFLFMLDPNPEARNVSNGRKVTFSTYGQRSSFVAIRRNPATKVVVAHHGMGKTRAARIVTNNLKTTLLLSPCRSHANQQFCFGVVSPSKYTNNSAL